MTTMLPKDDQTLLIVNCAKTWQEVERERVYICPAEGSNYGNRPCRYFGIYHDQKVSHVANIEAVIDVQPDNETVVRWIGGGGREADYRQKAVDAATRLRTKAQLPLQVFVLGYPQATDFRKGSRVGMQGSKQYMDVSSLGVETAGYLAGKLWDKKWSDLRPTEAVPEH